MPESPPRFHICPHYQQTAGPPTPPLPPAPILPNYVSAPHSLYPPPVSVEVPGLELSRSRSEGLSAFRYSSERLDFSYPTTTSTSTVEITHGRYQRSSSHALKNQKLPHSRSSQAERRRPSSSTASPPPPPLPNPSDQPADLTSQLARSIPELRKAILELLSVVTKQEESPLVSSMTIAVEGGFQVQSLAFKVKTQTKMREGDVVGIHKDWNTSPAALDFRLVKWHQQRRLLDLEFRRLLTWETRLRVEKRHARGSEYPTIDEGRSAAHDIETVKTAFSSIGRTLVGVLKRDCDFGREVNRVNQLLQCDTRGDPPRSQFQRSDDPLKSIQTAVDSLFGLLRPLKRTRDQPLRRSVFEFSSYSHTAFRRETRSLNLFDVPGAIGLSEGISAATVLGQKKPQVAQPACSHLKAADSDASEQHKRRRVRHKPNKKSSDKQKLRGGGGLASSSRRETQHGNVDPEKKIVLKIADRANAFVEENCPPNSGTFWLWNEKNEETPPRIKRIGTNEAEMIKKLDPKISELNKLFSSLSFQTGFSSAGIVGKLLDLAQQEKPIDGPGLLSFNPEASTLYRLDSILALFTGLPDWQIYTMPDQKKYSMAAVSMIKYSLLEQVMVCVVDFSHDLRSRLEKPAVSSAVELRFFCACIQRLSKCIGNMNGGLQSQLGMLTTTLTMVVVNIGQSSTTKGKKESVSSPYFKGNKQESQDDAMIGTASVPTPGSANAGSDTMGESDSSFENGSSGIAEDFENEFRSAFSKYRPLALACYLESAVEQGSDLGLHPTYVPSGLESLTVKDLFSSSDVGMPDAV